MAIMLQTTLMAILFCAGTTHAQPNLVYLEETPLQSKIYRMYQDYTNRNQDLNIRTLKAQDPEAQPASSSDEDATDQKIDTEELQLLLSRPLQLPSWKLPQSNAGHTVSWTMHYTDQRQDREADNTASKSVENEGLLMNVPPKPWVAPPYYQSLVFYSATLQNIQSHLQYYDDNYEMLVTSLAKKAVVSPQESVEMIRCVLRRANENIEKIKALLYNEWTQYICKAQPAACDTVIFSHIKTCGDDQLGREANILLELGDAASTYLKSYAKVFDAITEQNAYLYILGAKDAIRELVQKNAMVLVTLYPNGAFRESCVKPEKYLGHLNNEDFLSKENLL